MNDQQIIENLTEKLEEAQAEILQLKQRPSIEGMIANLESLKAKAEMKEDKLLFMSLSYASKFAQEYLKKVSGNE
ncbi:hypothetical protein [Vibrio phage vB_VpM-pA2SJ1]|uniref:Uncharacterized protein n=1 Tax=Vibrio phage vB_VpM-pA2SJ1 TaxID=3095964 RepID=A0AAX4J5R2_9CAUD